VRLRNYKYIYAHKLDNMDSFALDISIVHFAWKTHQGNSFWP
jgi:hypothetical protein